MPDVLGAVSKLQEALGGGPFAAFLAIALVAGAGASVLYIREVRAHQATLREVLTLTTTISKTWETHLEKMDRLEEDWRMTLAIFRALQPRLTPTETPRVGG